MSEEKKPEDFSKGLSPEKKAQYFRMGGVALVLFAAVLLVWGVKETRQRKAYQSALAESEVWVQLLLENLRQYLEITQDEIAGQGKLGPGQLEFHSRIGSVLDQLAKQSAQRTEPTLQGVHLSLALGELFLATGQGEKARTEIEKAAQQAQTVLTQSPSSEAEEALTRAHLAQADIAAARGDPKTAKALFDRVFQTSLRNYNADNARFTLPLIRSCARLGKGDMNENRLLDAKNYFSFALEVIKTPGIAPQGLKMEERMDLENNLAETFLRLKDNIKAREYWEQALQTGIKNQESKPKSEIAKILITLTREQLAGFHLRFSDTAIGLGLLKENEKDFRTLVLANPSRLDFQKSLGFACLQEAEACFLLERTGCVTACLREAEQIFSSLPAQGWDNTRTGLVRSLKMRIAQALQDGKWKDGLEVLELMDGLLDKWKKEYSKEVFASEKASLEADKKLLQRLEIKGLSAADLTTGLEPALAGKLEFFRSRMLARAGKSALAEKALEPFLKKEKRSAEEEIQLARTYGLLAKDSSLPVAEECKTKAFDHLKNALLLNPTLRQDLYLKPEFLPLRQSPHWADMLQGN